MFSFLRKKKEAEKDVDSMPQIQLEDEAIRVPVRDEIRIPEQKSDEPQPYSTDIQNLLEEKLFYILNMVDNKAYPIQNIVFDKVHKRRWVQADRLGFSADQMITEEEFWAAYVKKFAGQVIKEGNSKTLVAINESEMRAVRIDEITKKLEEASQPISNIRDRIKSLADKRCNIDVKKGKTPVSKCESFVFGGVEYKVTPKNKKVLLALENRTGWTTSKELAGYIHESEPYICKALHRLMNKGLPITSTMASGKRFWALIRDGNQGDNKEVLRRNPDLIIHALYLLDQLNGRPPSTSDIADQLKLDVTSVKNELSRLELQRRVKSKKILINGKKIKVWEPDTGKGGDKHCSAMSHQQA